MSISSKFTTLPPLRVILDCGSSCPLGKSSVSVQIANNTELLGQQAYNFTQLSISGGSCNLLWLSAGRNVKPCIQKGPQCGFVALLMAAHALNREINLTDLLLLAQKRGFTLRGELFSAYFMEELAAEVCHSEILDTWGSAHKIWKHLLQGDMLLVPYDSDKNHHPCCQNGYNAHWALLSGCLLVIDDKCRHIVQKSCKQDSSNSSLFHTQAGCNNELVTSLEGAVHSVFVYGMQGKSRYPGVWSLSDLLLSNQNLNKVRPDRDNEDYIIPPDGIENELCGKAVLLKAAQ